MRHLRVVLDIFIAVYLLYQWINHAFIIDNPISGLSFLFLLGFFLWSDYAIRTFECGKLR